MTKLLGGALATALSVLAPALALAMEGGPSTYVEAEKFEYRLKEGADSLVWDAQAWVGGDDAKAWLKTEGEKPTDGKLEKAETQLLYSRRISDFFDAQAGLRYDFEPGPERAFAVLGLQGLAPHWFEIDAAAFLSHEGELSARFKADYDLLITQQLVLQPSAELNLAAHEVRERGIGAGFNTVELGLRLRYELAREFAPYVGVNWERKLGETAGFARRDGEEVDAFSLVTGIRFWF